MLYLALLSQSTLRTILFSNHSFLLYIFFTLEKQEKGWQNKDLAEGLITLPELKLCVDENMELGLTYKM